MTRYFSIFLFFSIGLVVKAQSYNNNFISGERLQFVIYYGFLDAGIVEAELNSTFFAGKSAYHARMLARTTGLADRLYKVRDEYSAYFNPQTILPYKSVRDINEGRYTKYHVDTFYHEAGKVINLKGVEHKIPLDTRDMVTVFFHIRNLDYSKMKDGDIIRIVTFFDDEIFPFDMRYRGTETIKTRMGRFNCIKLVPFVEPGRIFNKEDDMIIWLSNDRNRIPVRVSFNLKVGSIKCDLIGHSGLKY